MVCNKSTHFKGCFSTRVSGERWSKHTASVCYVDHNRQRAYLFYFTPFTSPLLAHASFCFETFLRLFAITRYLITSCTTPNPKSPLTHVDIIIYSNLLSVPDKLNVQVRGLFIYRHTYTLCVCRVTFY